ncbi:MAG: hypothetical protein WA418_39335 [Bradyrhizobium sp.]
MAAFNHEFRKRESELFLSEGLDRANQLDGFDEIGREAQAMSPRASCRRVGKGAPGAISSGKLFPAPCPPSAPVGGNGGHAPPSASLCPPYEAVNLSTFAIFGTSQINDLAHQKSAEIELSPMLCGSVCVDARRGTLVPSAG